MARREAFKKSRALPRSAPREVCFWVLDHDVKEALIRIGAPAVWHLVSALNEEPWPWAVVWALGEMGPVARAAVPELNRQRDAREPTFKAYVDEALAKIEAPAESAPGSTPGAAEES